MCVCAVVAYEQTFLKLTSLPTWSALSATQRQIEFQRYPKLERHWKNVIGSEASDESDASGQEKPAKRQKTTPKKKKQQPQKAQTTTGSASVHEKAFITDLIDEFLALINEPLKATKGSEIDQKLLYTALFLAFVTDLLSQLPTRRFLQVVLRRVHLLMRVRRSPLVTQCLQWRSQFEISALKKQIALVEASMCFAIDSHTGRSFSAREQRELVSKHIQTLQQCAFEQFRNTPLEELAIIPVSSIADKKSLMSHLKPLVDAERAQVDALSVKLGVLSGPDEAPKLSNEELLECFVDEFSATSSDNAAEWTETPVFPTELDIWSDLLDDSSAGDAASNVVYGADESTLMPLLPIRKLNLQFLNVADYLQRNYELFRLEAASEIRGNLESTIKQLDAVRSLTSSTAETVFRGFSQMASPLSSPFAIMKISKPALGKTTPASVIGQFDVELDSRHDFKAFDVFQPREVVYLVTLRATNDEAAEAMGFAEDGVLEDVGGGLYFPEQYGVLYVRGAEVLEVVDGYGSVLSEESTAGKGRKRTLKVALDGVQYKKDLDADRLDAYQQVNVLVRRKPRENNFKAVLDTILSACGDAKREELLPSWLHDLFLGYGDPSAATFMSICKQRQQKEVRVPLLDLVADADHALETCFDENASEKRFVDVDDPKKPLAVKDAVGPFTLVEDLQKDGHVVVHAHRRSAKQPDVPNKAIPATVRFTKSQVAAVRSSMCEGLTMVVGPPGTGKTDVAVQLVLNLHRTTPSSEKILIVAHSNQALNDFFSKILSRKLINEAEIVRLGQGHRSEASSSEGQISSFHDDFSRNGRVNFLLQRRLDLLKEVEFMAKWLEQKDPNQYSGLSSSAGYSCENALFFYQFHVQPLLVTAREEASASSTKALDDVLLNAYFTARNGAAPESREKLLELVTMLDAYFGELHRLQPFELLQTPRQRGDLYLIQHARIVAMTCTHAALNQRKLVDLGLTFGSLIMEEAGQVSEVDSLIPLLLASTSSTSVNNNEASLKRVVLMGDPHQLAPVVKSQALKNYAHLDQSLFTRLLRLDVPRIVLDQQGRSRSALADLYRWKYAAAGETSHQLSDLPRVAATAEFQAPNAGFAHVAQLIHVPSGRERQVRAFAYENEEEARFVVALAKYMLTIGYSAEQITILATYNAQKELLQRLLRRNSSSESKALQKCKVSTVDRFQGQQNDFILLSTVRSGSSVGHLRDVRRACTAFSRARLGFYVFGNEATLRRSKELEPFVSRLLQIAPDQSTQLALIPTERVGEELKRDEPQQQQQSKKKSVSKKSGTEVVQLKKTDGAAQLEAIVAELLKTKSS